MTSIYKTILLLIMCSFVLQLRAQSPDPRYDQFYASPLQLNPALSGVFNGTFRFVANYRDQWASILDRDPIRTAAFSFDYRYNVIRDDYFAAGMDLLTDQAGPSKFRHSKGHLNVAYLKKLSGAGYNSQAQYLIAGAQIGLGQASLDFSNVWFTSQFDMSKEEIDLASSSNELLSENSNTYLDFNAGLVWYGVIEEDFSVYAGAAIHHLNNPEFTFLDNRSNRLYEKYSFHTGAQIPFSRELSILPAVVYNTQGPSDSYTFGANLRYSNRDWHEIAVRIGSWIHLSNELESSALSDAIIFTGILEYERLQFGLSYGINSSSLVDATNGRGAYEISLLYVHPERSRRPK